MNKCGVRNSLVFGICLLAFGMFVSAATVQTVNLAQLVDSAERVFFGRCLSVESIREPRTGIAVNHYRFQVMEAFKGVETGEVVTVRQVAAASKLGPGIAGLPQYRKGQRLLLFMHGDSRLGLTSPVGLGQGTFREEFASSEEIGLVNAVANANLAYELADRIAQERGLNAADVRLLRSRSALPLSRFREIVNKLTKNQSGSGSAIR